MPDPVVCLTLALRADLLHLARKAAPLECCGVLLGHSSDGAVPVQVVAVRQVPNAEVERKSERFRIDPHHVLNATRAAREVGLEVIGFFHSHPQGSARPSAEDIAEAGAWPGTLHIILSPAKGELRIYETDTSAWRECQLSPARP